MARRAISSVRATSADGSFTDQGFTISINDVDEFDVTTPVDSDVTANAVDENAASNTVVGVTVLASDADATNNTITYTLGRYRGRTLQDRCGQRRGDRRQRHAARS